MRKLLSIIIPRHKETEKEIFPLLASINGQVGIDFADIEAIICNDGEKETTPLDEGLFSLFQYDMKQITGKANRGCGPARQEGIDIAKGDYILCCDADDTLHNVGALGAFMKEAEMHAPDMAASSWLEEVIGQDGMYAYITHENDNTWMHGKMYRRQFLIQNNIRFPDFLRVQEDSYFNGLAAEFAEKRIYIPAVTYVWRFNANSTTRRDNGIYTYRSMPDFIKSCSMVHKEIEKRKPERMEYKIVQFVAYMYFRFHRPEWKHPAYKECLKAGEEAFAMAVQPFWHYFKDASPETAAGIYNEERMKNFAGHIEGETIWEWAERLGLDNAALK